MNARYGEHDTQYKTAAEREQQLTEEHTKMLTALERGRVQVRARRHVAITRTVLP